MNLEINIEKKHFWMLLLATVTMSTVLLVYAYTTAIPDPGHGGETVWVSILGVEKTLQDAIDSGELVDTDTDTQCDSSGSCNQICIDNDCVSSWSETLTKGNIECTTIGDTNGDSGVGPNCDRYGGLPSLYNSYGSISDTGCPSSEYWITQMMWDDIGSHDQCISGIICCRKI